MAGTIHTRTDEPEKKIQEVNDALNYKRDPKEKKIKLKDTAEKIINLGLSHSSIREVLAKHPLKQK
jgi:hypothetical protein